MGTEFSPGAQRVVISSSPWCLSWRPCGWVENPAPVGNGEVVDVFAQPAVISVRTYGAACQNSRGLVVIVVLFCPLLSAAGASTHQFNDLARKWPTYKSNLHAKLETCVRPGGFLQSFQTRWMRSATSK